MQEKNGLLKKRDIAHQFKTQQGNTLVPVIIALAISMVATLGFIKQGNNLSNTTNQLLAQNEITKLIGHWNSLKTIKAKKNMDEKNDFPDLSENTYGLRQIFFIHNTGTPQDFLFILAYDVPTMEDCRFITSIFNSKTYGILKIRCNSPAKNGIVTISFQLE